jgi:hypothetical protein
MGLIEKIQIWWYRYQIISLYKEKRMYSDIEILLPGFYSFTLYDLKQVFKHLKANFKLRGQ